MNNIYMCLYFPSYSDYDQIQMYMFNCNTDLTE